MFPSDTAAHRQESNLKPTERIPLREIAERTILQQIAPASALVNEQGDIFYLHGRTGMFLEPASGEVGRYNIIKMAREGLRRELSITLHKAVQSGSPARRSNILVKTNDHVTPVNLNICPAAAVPGNTLSPSMYLVMLEESLEKETQRGQTADTNLKEAPPKTAEQISIAALKKELRAKEEYLQTTNEELQTANEELKSSNEEMQSMNEELQSANEELETSKEELQSVNEELATVNAELHTKVGDLSRANNDMNNLLAGTVIATIFVDHQLRILRFTPPASAVINLIQSDIGRPVGHLVSNLVDYTQMITDIQQVLDTLVPKEVEVLTIKGDWFTMRILPYRTIDNVIEGAVVTFVNVTDRKYMEEQIRKQLTEKETLLKEVHHRIKNNIASIGSLLELRSNSVTDGEARSILQETIGRINSMGVLYENLLISEDYSDSSVKNYIEDLIGSIQKIFTEQGTTAIQTEISDFLLPSKTLFSLGIIVNELLTNSMKYAFPGRSDGLITVSIKRKANHITLTVEDNGCGLPENFTIDDSKGFGLSLVKMLSEQLEGSDKLESVNGTKNIIKFDV